MYDHAITPEKLYQTMPEEPQKIYPSISIPAEAFEKGEYQPGDECCIEIYVKIGAMTESHYQCDLLKSEDCTEEEEEEK